MDAPKVSTADISVRSLGKVFGEPPEEVVALKDIDLGVGHNEFVTLVGASGCGKSTLLRIVGGLEYHTSGEVVDHPQLLAALFLHVAGIHLLAAVVAVSHAEVLRPP